VALLLLAIGSAPYIWAALTTPAHLAYVGLMFDVPDHAQYWSWVTASRQGLFISNTMTPEPNPPVFMNPMMWVLAQIQDLFDLSFPALFQVWRVLGTVVVVAAAAAFVRSVVPPGPTRTTTFWVALLGGGLGWVLVVWKYLAALPDVPFPTDVYTVEPNTFFASLAYPYLALAQGLLVLALTAIWRFHETGRPGALGLACGAALALALSHPYDLLTLYVVVAGAWVVWLLRERRLPRRLTGAGVLVGGASAPVAAYYRGLTSGDPLWQAVLAQYPNAGVWTPPHLHLGVLLGIPLVLALAAVPRAVRDDRQRFLVLWAGLSLVLAYLPVVFQIKLLTGLQFPLAALAASFWHARVEGIMRRVLTRTSRHAGAAPILATALLVVLAVPTNVYLFAWRFMELGRHQAPYFLHRDELAALDWLARTSAPDDVALAPVEIGQFIPNYGETRAYLAHWAMTVRFLERRDAVEAFFSPQARRAERLALLGRDGVTLVLAPAAVSPRVVADLSATPGLELTFERPAARVYRYRGAATADAGRDVR
jgi:hypothetical protein